MRKDDMAARKLSLLDEFMRYAFDHPAIIEQIPEDAHVVILPADDPELSAENQRMVTELRARGERVVLIKFKRPEVHVPELELLTA